MGMMLDTVGFLRVGWCCRGMFLREMDEVEMRGR